MTDTIKPDFTIGSRGGVWYAFPNTPYARELRVLRAVKAHGLKRTLMELIVDTGATFEIEKSSYHAHHP